jgi:hypothetical protein
MFGIVVRIGDKRIKAFMSNTRKTSMRKEAAVNRRGHYGADASLLNADNTSDFIRAQ